MIQQPQLFLKVYCNFLNYKFFSVMDHLGHCCSCTRWKNQDSTGSTMWFSQDPWLYQPQWASILLSLAKETPQKSSSWLTEACILFLLPSHSLSGARMTYSTQRFIEKKNFILKTMPSHSSSAEIV